MSGGRSVCTRLNFYPRPPRGGRRLLLKIAGKEERISIHALREEGDTVFMVSCSFQQISIHALREEGDWSSSGYWE